ncbi:MAG: hypothetical protein AB7L41_02210 [Flavobacteriaceae bacterium]
MKSLFFALAGAMAFASAACADAVTSRVVSWAPDIAGKKGTLTFADGTKVELKTEQVPADIAPGQNVQITYTGSDDGILAITRVEVLR